ncbi:cell division cycle protein 123 [Pseudohyphozyma bogoriensis]|nr:cell division cycle protein 123 [Pseudohyphozyma bogoriensis]
MSQNPAALELEEQGFPRLTKVDVLACRFSSWYPGFRKISPKATIIKPLEERFIAYLESDGVFIPEGSGPMGVSELSDDEDDGNGSDSSRDLSWQIEFTALDAEIRDVIRKYDGPVFPKLNWSCPQDAAWMVAGSNLKCQTPADVYLLLKSSDFISHDLDHAFDLCIDATPVPEEEEHEGSDDVNDITAAAEELQLDAESTEGETTEEDDSDSDEHRPQPRKRERNYDFELVLKKWFEMPRSQEWRCIVRDHVLIAITQRDINYYEFLQPEYAKDEVRSKICDFFSEHISGRFPSSSYVFDVYFTRSNDRIFLIDFSPYSPTTDCPLIPWADLNSLSTSSPSLPLLEVVTSATLQSLPSFSHNRYPKDVVDLSSGTSIAEFAEKWRGALADGVLGSDGESTTGSVRSGPGR